MKILFVVGTRPEAIKMAPVILEANKHGWTSVIATGQHKDVIDILYDNFRVVCESMLDIPDNVNTLPDLMSSIIPFVSTEITKKTPFKYDYVVVQGDTISTLIGAWIGFLLNIKVVHIEAGLRSFNKLSPFPEEMIRRVVGQIADYHFCPTQQEVDHLTGEGIYAGNCFVVGNTVIDAAKLVYDPNYNIGQKQPFAILTLHRRENWGRFFELLHAVKAGFDKGAFMELVYPMHPNPKLRKHAHSLFDNCEWVHLVDSIPYKEFINIIARSRFIITDSGGIQEEATYFGVPLLILRDETERHGILNNGAGTLVGTNPINVKNTILKYVHGAWQGIPLHDRHMFGDGTAAVKIIDKLREVHYADSRCRN